MGDSASFDRDAGEPPADFKADVRGLPPARAHLARLVAWARRKHDTLSVLETGRKKVAAQIEAAESTANKRLAADVDASALSIVERIRRGADCVLDFSAKKQRDATTAP